MELAPRSHGRSAPNERTHGSQPLRVLIVDDDDAFVSAAAHALSGASPAFEVTAATSGAAALEALRHAAGEGELPDLLLLDYHLPDTTAPSLLRHLAGTPGSKPLPVLVLTRDARDEARDAALDAGASDFATKPSRLRALREIVVRFWESHGPTEDPPG
jgi:CheY-like chemotaxis protein